MKIGEKFGKLNVGGDRELLVGVSGGIDSVTLADMLCRQGLTGFSVAHCNFHLRGSESDGDARFVQDWAEERGLRFHRMDFDTAGYARKRGVSIEMAARELRYGWFAMLMKRHGYSVLAVAHNANDNAETLILNLVRGTGLRGICGMQSDSVQHPEVNPHLAAALGCELEDIPRDIRVWRPLLDCTRDQIEGYAGRYSLKWREDSTNSSREYKRNLIRNEVMPLLERLNPSVVKTLNRDMRHFAEVRSILGGRFETDASDGMEALAELVARRGEGWKYALYVALSRLDFNGSVIAQIEELLESGRTLSGKTFYGPSHRLVTTSDSFVIELRDEAAAPEPTSEDEVVITGPGEYRFSGQTIAVELFDRPADFSPRQKDGVTAVDADTADFPLVLRRWKSGDRMRPLGCRGTKKLSDLFVDLKFSLPQKQRSVLLVSSSPKSGLPLKRQSGPVHGKPVAEPDHILALLGYRIDESVRITPDSTRILRFTISGPLI